MTTLFFQILNLLVGAIIGIFVLQFSAHILKRGHYDITVHSGMNLAIAVVGGYMGSNVGNILDNNSGKDGISTMWNMFGCGFSVVPAAIGAAVVVFLTSAFLKRFA